MYDSGIIITSYIAFNSTRFFATFAGSILPRNVSDASAVELMRSVSSSIQLSMTSSFGVADGFAWPFPAKSRL
jgi:hypothetical protein